LNYLGTQCGLLLGFWFFAWVAALIAHRPWHEPDAGLRYLWWLSVPMFALFLLFSVKTEGGEPNWPVTAYVSGMVLTAGWLMHQLESSSRWWRRLLGAGLAATCVLGMALGLLMYYSQVAHPLLAVLGEELFPGRPMIVRRFDPTCRLRGWQTLALEVDRLRTQLHAEGIEPVLAGTGWALAGELGFYCQGQPAVYSVGLATGDRHSQYDLWRPNPVFDPNEFCGRTFIIVGYAPQLAQAFAEVGQPIVVTHCVDGRPVSDWCVTVCRGFRGFPAMPEIIGH
jgi:hypothetical protein